MSIPDWRTISAGSRSRVALWLVAEVGEGGVFTKARLREAFPAVEQIDRRMRDLRAEGWKIATNREDASLASDELRLLRVGGRVWEPGYRNQGRAVSDKQRQAVLTRDGYLCRSCGVRAGDAYPDDPVRTAKLVVASDQALGGALVTLCDRCASGRPEVAMDESTLLAEIEGLEGDERGKLVSWIRRGSRDLTQSERLWGIYMRMAPDSRERVLERLADVKYGGAPG
jgi:hypothetical protein